VTHNQRQRRDRLMREIREAHTRLLWNLPRIDAPGKRACTLAAKVLADRATKLHRLLGGQ